jgi:hypothetical protein
LYTKQVAKIFTCTQTLKAIYYRYGKRKENNTAESRIEGKFRQVINGFVKTDICQFHFRRYLKRRIAAVYCNSGRQYYFCDIGSRRIDIRFTKKEQEVIMQVIVFMVGCTVPLLIIGCVILWREKQWEKQNKQENANGA